MRRLPGFVVLARLGGETAERAGEVYRARRVATGESVAIRVFPAADDSMAWSDVQAEIDLLSGISDPAVVAVLEVIVSDGVPHILSEYVPNGSVAEFIGQRDEPLSIGEAVMVGERTAAALAAAHEVDVVHLGVTPHNVLIDASGQVRLTDLGLSTLRQAGTHHPWAAARTDWYDTDEPADQGHVEPATDVLALGTMLSDLVRSAATDATGPEGDVPADVAARLHGLIAACLDADPSARPSAAEARDELESIAGDLGPLRCTALVAAPPVKRKAARAPIAPTPAAVGSPPAAGVGSPPASGVGYPPEDWPRQVGWRDAAAIVGFIVASVAGTVALAHRNSSHYFEYAAPAGAAIAADADPDESETTDTPSTSLAERITAPTTTDPGAGRGEQPEVTTPRTFPRTSESTSTTLAAAARSDRRDGIPSTTSPADEPAPCPSTTTPSGPAPDPTTPPPTTTIPAPGPGPTTTTPSPSPGTTTTVPGPVPTTPPPTATTAPPTPTTTSPTTSPPPRTTTTTTAPATTTTTAPPPLGLPLPTLPPLPPLPPLLP